jgi:hypothetical protein
MKTCRLKISRRCYILVDNFIVDFYSDGYSNELLSSVLKKEPTNICHQFYR